MLKSNAYQVLLRLNVILPFFVDQISHKMIHEMWRQIVCAANGYDIITTRNPGCCHILAVIIVVQHCPLSPYQIHYICHW
jgi:hypothetical protein